MNGHRSVLVVDDVAEILHLFERFGDAYAGGRGCFEVVALSDPVAAVALLAHRSFDVVVSDYRMPLVDGVRVLSAACARNPGGRRVLMTGYNEIPATCAELALARPTAQLKKPVRFSSLAQFFDACFNEDPVALAAYQTAEA